MFFLIAVMGLLLFDHDHHKENLAEYRILSCKAGESMCLTNKWMFIVKYSDTRMPNFDILTFSNIFDNF